MGIRIKPLEIEIPKDDPFKNDLLGRKEPAEVLTNIVGSIEGPCALAIDATWGAGKTTFLRLWSQHLRNEGFPVVEFNAWETDFSSDPFLALSSELTEGLRDYGNELLEPKIANTKKAAQEVLRRAIPGVIRFVTRVVLDINPLLENEVGQALASFAEERLTKYQETQEAIGKFRNTLQDMAGTLSESNKNRPLMVIIDELDRCRPSYAVELLEIAKHLFAVDHIVFVLAINRPELAHSIKALYGNDFDAKNYLRRFFDVDFRLPEPDRNAFINRLLESVHIYGYLGRTSDEYAQQEANMVWVLLEKFFSASGISLRQVAQAIHHLGLVLASLRSNHRSFFISVVVVLILRTLKTDLYHQFIRREISDLEVIDELFQTTGSKSLQEINERCLFEAAIILGFQELSGDLSYEQGSTPLMQRYKDMEYVDGDDTISPVDREHADNVLSWVDRYQRASQSRNGFGFKHSVDRIELLSTSLIDEAQK